jgi:serine/threonine protein kinase
MEKVYLQPPGSASAIALLEATAFASDNNHSVHEHYLNHSDRGWELYETIRCGGFAIVLRARQRSTMQFHAIKIIHKDMSRSKLMKYCSSLRPQSEIDIIEHLKHDSIIAFVASFESVEYLYIFTEYAHGRDLLEYMLTYGAMTEDSCRYCFYRVFLGIAYLHSSDIVHRDLKLENLVLSSTSSLSNVKIIDFGLAKNNQRDRCTTVIGTWNYMAPEVWYNRGRLESERIFYTQAVDMWSMGVILYASLAYETPYEVRPSTYVQDIFELSWDDSPWFATTPMMIQFLKKLLCRDPALRASAQASLSDPWLSS